MDESRCASCGTPHPADDLVELRSMKLCANCKADVVRDMKSGFRPVPPCPPEAAREIRRQIESYRRSAIGYGGVGLVLAVTCGGIMAVNEDSLVVFPMFWLTALGTFLTYVGAVFYALMKGRSGGYAYLLMFTVIGLALLLLLRRVCRHCDGSHPPSLKQCPNCGAPL